MALTEMDKDELKKGLLEGLIGQMGKSQADAMGEASKGKCAECGGKMVDGECPTCDKEEGPEVEVEVEGGDLKSKLAKLFG